MGLTGAKVALHRCVGGVRVGTTWTRWLFHASPPEFVPMSPNTCCFRDRARPHPCLAARCGYRVRWSSPRCAIIERNNARVRASASATCHVAKAPPPTSDRPAANRIHPAQTKGGTYIALGRVVAVVPALLLREIVIHVVPPLHRIHVRLRLTRVRVVQRARHLGFRAALHACRPTRAATVSKCKLEEGCGCAAREAAMSLQIEAQENGSPQILEHAPIRWAIATCRLRHRTGEEPATPKPPV
jgi:hypothetical protein